MKQYEIRGECYNGLASVKLNGKWGFINREGEEVISLKYDYVSAFYRGLAIIKVKDRYGFVDTQGVEIIPCIYDEVGHSDGDTFWVESKRRILLVNRELEYFDPDTRKRINCGECPCYNDKLVTGLCCKFGE